MTLIWLFTAKGSPQNIGHADGTETGESMINAAQAAGHTSAKVCLQYREGSTLMIHMFDSLVTLNAFIERNQLATVPYDLWYLSGQEAAVNSVPCAVPA